jgi:hypothetical protein
MYYEEFISFEAHLENKSHICHQNLTDHLFYLLYQVNILQQKHQQLLLPSVVFLPCVWFTHLYNQKNPCLKT